ncbi:MULTISPECIES: class I SAM-dependent methyltransferase [Trichocoleus]|uniref:Class I SAM-dependent methyltransferase n=1 Tax=Trichocoleus desertorum GB2-A4 TaxID=2933944 RepID=A0ABV0JH93_9CYAN|nr:class I SAM-dependent methyltransferase [Trichocoleus sp. FACHB-46]MBD1865109.1 class I SAM-dependent methyltransferase [Trichocoleus sp. FACHB-46]
MSNPLKPAESLSNEAFAYYEQGQEAQRLLQSQKLGPLELIRTQELLTRYLPDPPAVIFDVGGGSGIYACWLAQQGYEVHLVDAVPLHVEQARAASQAQLDRPLASVSLGDSRQLDRADFSVDVVLLMGPLYHLIDRRDRVTALREAYRILKLDGLIFAVGVSRFASVLGGLRRGHFDDPTFVKIVQQDLSDGQHRNPDNHPAYFTTAFFHHPEELREEIAEAGFSNEKLLAIQGLGAVLPNFEEHWSDTGRRERLLQAIRWLEAEPSTLGVTSHMMAIAQKR